MANDAKVKEIERLLQEMKGKEESTPSGFWKSVKVMAGVFRKTFLVLAILLLLLFIALPLGTYWMLNGSTATESKIVFLEEIRNLNELSTAEAFSKAIIKREDNEVFGREIGLDLPGTKRQLLVVIPGSVKAGIDFSEVTEDDIEVDEEAKTATLTLPKADFLGGPELFMDQVEVVSNEELFRGRPDISEAYGLLEEAQKMMLEETEGQGLLERAEENGVDSVQGMFQLVGYDVSVEFKD